MSQTYLDSGLFRNENGLGMDPPIGYPIKVAVMSVWDALFWHSKIQPIIQNNNRRADVHWNWPVFRTIFPQLQEIRGRRCKALTTFTKNRYGNPVPIAMHLIIERYPHLPNQNETASFVWFMATAPKEAFKELEIPGNFVELGRICVDTCLITSYGVGLDGKLDLHCAPRGGSWLFNFYLNDCKLINLPNHVSINVAGRSFKNDGRYFNADLKRAKELTDYFRV